ncbi:MAG: multiprotein bridging factor aMBF1 [Candidatus Thermoplasmatota archaeon]|jgi:putative transcription factor|uniref:multiprotein bridging factor aMBF1 n=1 Tax=Ferroplasma sp. TaxID=2591003 RepID=UPI00038960B4|nr:multiprotein bridging factor aMBF1 [Ferroplasma sp.]EQB74499.1 MAG: hypothetical protein AMDU4_FER2C00006G0041 [Ferroplasma sp. Type II]MCL4312162.1 multiprotein bridging factor aMBF1 [Candidatus Thermoplasmatota archaeon]
MNCEMCGDFSDKLIKIRVSGAILNVCPKCAKFGDPVEEKKLNKISENITIKFPEKKINVVTYKKPFKKSVTSRKPVRKENVEELDVVEDYANLIKNKREEMQMTQDDLAKKIFERKNVLSNIERGELLPDIITARKLEKVLNIKLLEKN